MDREFPQSEGEALQDIRRIRREKGLGDDNKQIGHNASDLQSALNVLSDDLYQSTTHFLLELIQNADDNSYPSDVTPTLAISYSPGRLRIDCNERGFTRNNVEAICRICKSTKSGRSKSSGFVGEKGIGFKAVFKVASTVWISSGYYTFRFDRDGHLGMIAPIWGAFPETKETRAGTSILLDLAHDCDQFSIPAELNKYNPKILMFLRRLRRLEINIEQRFWTGRNLNVILSRQDQATNGQAQMVTLFTDSVATKYLVWRHVVKNMPKDTKRPGTSDSEIVLAFPVTADGYPILENQDVYAFLPVKSIGLPFLLQGDFLLAANREGFDADSEWNKALVKASTNAFINAARHMSRLKTNLRYTWIRFVPISSTAIHTLWEEYSTEITATISRTEVFETHDGRYMEPKKTVHIPRIFCDRRDRPFVSSTIPESHRLSTGYKLYSDKDKNRMRALGVDLMTEYEFQHQVVKALKDPVTHKLLYMNKDAAWHKDFCTAINKLGYPFWESSARTLYIVPLPGGLWARPSDRHHFMRPATATEEDELLPVPGGLDIKLVDQDAMEDPERRRTCEKAELTTLSNKNIAEAIISKHRLMTPPSTSPESLVSHAVFLFNTGWTFDEANQGQVWMAATSGACRRGMDMYLPSNLPSSTSRILPAGSHTQYGILHPAYLDAVNDDKNAAWVKWLTTELAVECFPRLFTPSPQGPGDYALNKRYLHRDFKSLMYVLSPVEWLSVLRDGWDTYRKCLDESLHVSNGARSNDIASSCTMFVSHIRDFRVPCKGSPSGIYLRDAFQPTPNLVKEYGEFAPLIDLPEPEHKNWRPLLDTLKVPRVETASFYAECLRQVKKIGDEIPFNAINRLMRKMSNIKDTDNIFFQIFNKDDDPLICIPPKETGGKRQWVSARTCYWAGEPWLTGLHGLSHIYPDLEIFLRHHVKVPNINSKHMIDELFHVKHWKKSSTARIERLLLALTRYHTTPGQELDKEQKDRLKYTPCWPTGFQVQPDMEFTKWSTAEFWDWLIADRGFFREQFGGVLPLLAFSSDVVFRLTPLLEAMGMQDRMMSRVATNITEAEGEVTLHEGLSEMYRSRTGYLLRLMPNSQHDRQHVRDRFGNVEVYLASSIKQYWTAPLGIRQVESNKVSEGFAFLESDYAGDLRIYMKTGYDAEPFPIELTDRLSEFFNIPAVHKDFVNVVLTASVERIEKLFDERGVPPLLEDIPERPAADYEDPHDIASAAESVPNSTKDGEHKTDLGMSLGSRFARLLAHRRFSPNPMLRHPNTSNNSLPSYTAAIKQPGATGSSEKCKLKSPAGPVSHTLKGVNKTLKDLSFLQQGSIVKAKLPKPQGFLARVKNCFQADNDAAESIVCSVMDAVLGSQSGHGARVYIPHFLRNFGQPTFTFTDSHGNFSSFLQRLEGSTGRGQGYNRFRYFVDVKATLQKDEGSFTVTQPEVDRFRGCTLKAKETGDGPPGAMDGISVLVVVSDPRREPKMMFLLDPWDLYSDGHVRLEAVGRGFYRATLAEGAWANVQDDNMKAVGDESGFDAVQVRPHRPATWIPDPPPNDQRDQKI